MLTDARRDILSPEYIVQSTNLLAVTRRRICSLPNLLVNSIDFRGLRLYGTLKEVRKAAADKEDGLRRESAINILGGLFHRRPAAQPICEVCFLLQDNGCLNVALDALADDGNVMRDGAQYAVHALFSGLSSEAWWSPFYQRCRDTWAKRLAKWQVTVGTNKWIGASLPSDARPSLRR